MSRRKLKKERELVADIRKAFRYYLCNRNECRECPLRDYNDECIIGYVKMLLNNFAEVEDYEED